MCTCVPELVNVAVDIDGAPGVSPRPSRVKSEPNGYWAAYSLGWIV